MTGSVGLNNFKKGSSCSDRVKISQVVNSLKSVLIKDRIKNDAKDTKVRSNKAIK